MSFKNKNNKHGLTLSLVGHQFLNMSLHMKSSALTLDQSERFDYVPTVLSNRYNFKTHIL